LIVPRLTFERLATPLALVVDDPADAPLSVKLMLLPLTGLPPEVSVAERFVVPPKVPLALLAAKLELGVGVGVGVAHAPGPAVLSKKPETVPLKTEDVVVPVVLTTTTKFEFAGTVNEYEPLVTAVPSPEIPVSPR
jgi:hypothetical protein